MNNRDLEQKIQELVQQRKRRKRWYKLTAVLAAAAMVVTAGSLILPAMTMEKSPEPLKCQLDLHAHEESCYGDGGEPLCGYADFVVHEHDASCYDEEGVLICPLEEIKAHTHSISCYEETRVLTCGMEEGGGHTHNASCYGKSTESTCGLEEKPSHVHTGHIHNSDCYQITRTLTCGQEETSDHTHTSDCYETTTQLICDLDTGCYDEQGNLICGLSEGEGHTHAQDCYPDVLLCGKEEVPAHSHSDACYQVVPELVCGKEEIILHTHTPACYDREGNLICGQIEVREHVHDETCLPANPEMITTPAPSEDGEEVKPSPRPSVEPEGDRSTPAPAIDYEDPEAPQSPAPGQEGEVEASPTPEPEGKPSPAPEPEEEEKSQSSPSPAPEEGGEESAYPVVSGSSWAIVTKEESQVKENAVMLFSRLFSFAAPRADGSYDFSEDITSVTVEKQQDSQWIPSGTFTDGDTIRVTIQYAIPEGKITETQKTMHYKLPAGIALDKTEQGDVSQGDRVVGSFEIGIDGMIKITFNDAFAEGGEAFSGSLQFQGAIALAELGEGDKIIFGGDGGTITVVPEEKEYSLNIGKPGVYVKDEEEAQYYKDNFQLGDIDILPGHLLYTVSIWSDNGSDGTIAVTDRFTHDPAQGVVTYDEGNIAVFKITPTLDGPPSPVPITEFELEYTHRQTGADDTQTSSFTITGLPALQPGESYSINYTAAVDWDTVTISNGYIAVSNEAAAEDNSQRVSAESNVEISRRMVHKEASTNEGTGNVQWTVNINEDCRDISGMTFRDTMTYTVNGQMKPYAPTEIVNLQVTAYSLNDVGQYTKVGDVTEAFKELIQYEDDTLTIRFPEGEPWPTGLEPDYGYQLIYETPFPEEAGTGEAVAFQNTARLEEYTVTVNWNGPVPEQGYGLVKQTTDNDLNTGTDTGTVDWRSTISYPSKITNGDLGELTYWDWIADVHYKDGGQFIDGSHYTTLNTLAGTLQVKNVRGEALVWQTHYNVSVLYAKDMPQYGTLDEAFRSLTETLQLERTLVTEDVITQNGNEHVAIFCIEFTEKALEKLAGGRQLYISYQTLVDRKGVTDGETVSIDNVGAIRGQTTRVFLETAFHPRLQKQVSKTGMATTTTDLNLKSDVYVDGPVNIDLGDTGGKLYYRILFYNFGDSISFHDDMLQKFYGHITFHNLFMCCDAATGNRITAYTKSYLDDTDASNGNYTLNNLGRFKDRIIGLYYSINVSGDEALADLAEGKTLTYTNTVEWKGVGVDSAEANVTNSQPTLKKTSEPSEVDGEPWVTYYVVINPEGRDLHPTSEKLELRDTLSLPNGVTADLRLETLGLYHYNAEDEAGHYLGDKITNFDFEAVPEESAANTYTFTVPDEMACVVVYAYQINPGNYAGDIEVSNTASLLGRAVIGAGDEVVIKAQDSSALVNKATLTIYKIGGNDVSNLLDGVLFDLERYEPAGEGNYEWETTSITAAGEKGHFKTGGDGVPGAIILNFLEEQDGDGSHYNTLYRLKEYKTLDGYELDQTPRYYVWGEYGMRAEETAAVMADALKEANVKWDQVTFIPFGESKTEYIQNEPTTTEITVKKQWQGAEGTPLTEGFPERVEVTLYQVSKDGKQTEYVAADADIRNPVELNAGNNWTHTWKQLPKEVDGQAVTYIVKEGSPPEGWDVSYTYPEGANENTGVAEGEIIVINRERSTFTLPETGGFGPLQFAIAGLPLVGASGVVYLKQRRKRRRGGKTP